MRFQKLDLAGAYLVQPERHEDERGYFARTWCRETFAREIGDVDFVQTSQSFNRRAGTLRGLHFQAAPFSESKLVRCIRGAIYDVIVDIRPQSPSCGQWQAVELTEENGASLFIPDGFAHGFQTLEDNAEVAYQISAYYRPEAARGIRWNDRTLNVRWPLPVSTMSVRDREWPDFATARAA
jgi:dTDP-4-dehydrorhamnose 3,5-epimerase